jgi:Arc/MetJ-type ribon-helix-helix transcriptional regulator
VDADLIDAVGRLVARGHSASVSAWVNDALRSKLAHDRRLEALEKFIATYESDRGEITHDEMAFAARRARSTAVTVRGIRREKPARRGTRRSAR